MTKLLTSFDRHSLIKYLKNTKRFDRIFETAKVLPASEGHFSVELKVDESHLNPQGMLHHGVSATLIDTTLCFAIMSQERVPVLTLEMYLRYLKDAKRNDHILISASLLKTGEKIGFLDAEIKNKFTDELLVKGHATVYLIK